MGLLPTTGDDLDLVRFQIATQPGYTHKLDIDQQRVRGTTDERDAVLQAVYLFLKWVGTDQMERRITEALLQDDRITSLSDWEFEPGRKSVRASFVVHTIYGDIEASKEVDI